MWPLPLYTLTEVYFIAFASYYGNFIPGFSVIPTLITYLLNGEIPIIWRELEEEIATSRNQAHYVVLG